ncbi:MAG: PDZ domain-containing protein, partial [Phycisphaerales bacterium]|nr:PDZ domain-containing protein [Phycisphaerales bacterium]
MTFQNHASNRRHLVFGAMLALVAAPWVGAAPGAAAPVREDAKPATVERRALRTIVLDADPLHERKTDARSVEVRMADGKMNVWVDGEAIDLARVREENGHLVVLDEDGKPITTIGTGFDASGTSSMVLPGIELDTRIEAMLQGLMVPDDGTFTFEFGPVSVAPTPPAVMMGVTLAPADAATAYHLGVDAGAVTLVTSVIDDLPAARAGLHQYDLITAIDGRTPAAPADLHAILRDRAAGSTITLTVIQAGRTVQIPVVLEAFDAERLHQSTTDGLLRWSP